MAYKPVLLTSVKEAQDEQCFGDNFRSGLGCKQVLALSRYFVHFVY